ncbi:VanZ family protein [Salinarchaeum sp. IM2453]|uniref:VanZ family protein n=1 Tax=Salinarchaeum sp. IM2453 TaxID=2862870 RepID=UPI001C831472|nr:VanZ family protein [Salinarchaeum sp. IM2453]QZA89041.1 VanZ family protein [Salinarchaeum sp. IM2453]
MQVPLPLFSRRLRWAGVLVIAGFILYSSLLTVPETVVDDTQPDSIPINYWRHLVAYCVLACSLAYATDHWQLPRWRHALIVIGLAAGYGALIEAGQAFVPHRSSFLVSDVVVNTIGASGVMLWYLARPYLSLRPVSAFLSPLLQFVLRD